MINLDDRILSKVDQNELWLLMHLSKRLNKNRTCWPSNKALLRDLKWSIDKLQKCKKTLMDKGLLSVIIRKNDSGQSSNMYLVKTSLIGIYINLDDLGELEEEGDTGKTSMGGDTLKSGGGDTLKSGNEVLTNEVLINLPPNGGNNQEPVLNTDSNQESELESELFNTEDLPKKKPSKGAVEFPEYTEFIKIWHTTYPTLLKMPRDGLKVKQLITETKNQIKARGVDPTPENTVEFWTIFVQNLNRTWGHNKDLAVIESKYGSLILELEHGKPKQFEQKSRYEQTRDWVDNL